MRDIFNLICSLVNLIVAIMKRNCLTKRSMRFKSIQPSAMMRNLHFEFELGPLSNRVYNIQMRFPATK